MRLLATRLTSIASAAKRLFSPLSLFSLGEQGAWYDPSDLSTLFQDSAGTVPVTAVEQPVGRILDKSGRGNHAIQATTTSRPILKQDANGRYYLLFDGIDDGMRTSAIDFTATDKMTVFVGVRKLSDTLGIIAELSVNAALNDGAFYIVSGTDVGITGYSSLARGSATATSLQVCATFVNAPDTSVLSMKYDIFGDLSTMRRNAVNGTSSNADKGSGNFGNYPLYLGRRGGTSVPFNGHFYGLIIRGALSTDTQIISTEKWLANKTGVTL